MEITAEQFRNSEQGVAKMIEAINSFFSELNKAKDVLKANNPSVTIYTRDNGHLHGGYDLAINKHCIVSQHHIESKYTTKGSMLSLALFDLIFDYQGRAMDENGLPMGQYDRKHILRHVQYQCHFTNDFSPVWLDPKTGEAFTTDALLNNWIDQLFDLGMPKEA
jgi:hypothetical protein